MDCHSPVMVTSDTFLRSANTHLEKIASLLIFVKPVGELNDYW